MRYSRTPCTSPCAQSPLEPLRFWAVSQLCSPFCNIWYWGSLWTSVWQHEWILPCLCSWLLNDRSSSMLMIAHHNPIPLIFAHYITTIIQYVRVTSCVFEVKAVATMAASCLALKTASSLKRTLKIQDVPTLRRCAATGLGRLERLGPQTFAGVRFSESTSLMQVAIYRGCQAALPHVSCLVPGKPCAML